MGETLTADTSDIVDKDELTNVSYSYQWTADDTDIEGATDLTYELSDADVGKTINVKVSFTDDADNEETLTSAATAAVAVRPNSPPTGLPTISGTALVGETLEADTSGIDDQDGLVHASFSYQWVTDNSDIAGASDSTYTLVDADEGKAIKVKVGFTDDRGSEETLTSAATGAVAPRPDNPVADEETPVWSADMLVVEYTSASIGAASANLFSNQGGSAGLQAQSLWSYTLGRELYLTFAEGVSGADDLTLLVGDLVLAFPAGSSGQYSFTWKDVDVDWENGQTIAVRIVPTSALVEPTPNSPPTGLPAISGTAQAGEKLEADTSGIDDQDGMSTASFAYQWLAGGSDISGATGSSHTLTSSEQGQTIQVRVSFTDDADNDETLTSAATVAVAARPNSPPTGLPTISGTAQVGEKLEADTSGIIDTDGLTNATFTYQWVRNDGNGDTDIGGATGVTYTLQSSDLTKTLKVRVSFTDDVGNEESLTSQPVGPVDHQVSQQQANSPATGQPSISGTAQVGQTLEADTSGIGDDDGMDTATFSYQWLADDTDISGATGSTYTLVSGDQGKSVKVRVSFTDDADNDETLTSTATAAVAGEPAEPLTASVENTPASHNGTDAFTFEIRFSEEVKLSYKTLRDHVFTVTGGTVKKAKRQEEGSNIHWRITVEPDSNTDVTVVLPVTTECDDTGAVCTKDGERPLSNRLEFTVSGPGQ